MPFQLSRRSPTVNDDDPGDLAGRPVDAAGSGAADGAGRPEP